MIVITIVIDERIGVAAEAKVIGGFTILEQEAAEKVKVIMPTLDPNSRNTFGVDYDRKPRDAQ